MKMPRQKPLVPATTLIVFALLAAPLSRVSAAARADISSLQFSRSQANGLESVLSRPGTQIKILLTHGDADWRALDFDASKITAVVDDRGANLASSDSGDAGTAAAGIQADSSIVAADGLNAVLTVWAPGIPGNGAEQVRVTGSAAVFCGGAEEKSADRADIRVAGAETFNVQPFRVVTSHGDGTFDIELRYLKSEAFIKDAGIVGAGGRVLPPVQFNQTSKGLEWIWRGSFVVPPKTERVALTVHYLPIAKVETVPFDLTTGLAFGSPSTNPIVRWIKKHL